MSTQRILVVEHEPDDPPAQFGSWLEERGLALHVVQAWDDQPLPETLAGYAGFLVMGGWMSAHHDEEVRWLSGVKQLIREAASDGVPTLGICLGHQVAAVALGGHVGRNPAGRQFGLVEVGFAAAAADDPMFGRVVSGAVAQPRGIHWNDDVVGELPPGATLLATAPGGEIQIARHAPSIWGVQFHPEVDEPLVRRWAQTVDLVVDEGLELDEETEQRLAEIAEAQPSLVGTWRHLANSFADLINRQ
ncbi:MAG: type 1 glutamine amidotransferase [Nocardioides sp.]